MQIGYRFVKSKSHRNHFKHILSIMIILSVVMSMMIGKTVYASSDVSPWAVTEIEAINELGAYTERLTSNYQANVTRAEFTELVVLTYKAITGNSPIIELAINPFVDTEDTYILEAVALGLINGTDATHFSPDMLVTREQMVTIYIRMTKLVETELGIQVLGSSDVAFDFTDDSSISAWAYESMVFAYANSIISGSGNGTIGPKLNTSKEQALIVNYRLILMVTATTGYNVEWQNNFSKVKKQLGIVTCDVLNVRQTPNLDNSDNIIHRLQQYNKVTIEKQEDNAVEGWYYITSEGGISGFVHSEYIRTIEAYEEDTELGIAIIAYAKTYLGTPYSYGGSTIGVGIDCAGFTQSVLGAFGYSLSRSSSGQSKQGIAIDSSELAVGDLIVYGYSGNVSHVALYIGNGQVIHATTSRGVIITDAFSYLYKPLIGYRRVILD
ncbi:MAG: NlpC/P60 family protein [Vallitaleaceae bacterium]|jgi:hypothetical protein|nr:NlpC/P60 family protein [Vallitaleaceae bacterium]